MLTHLCFFVKKYIKNQKGIDFFGSLCYHSKVINFNYNFGGIK